MTMETAPEQDLRVLVVGDDALSRAGLAALLGEQAGCTVVGQVGLDAGASLSVYQADVIVCDLGWDPADGMEGLASPQEDGPPVLALLPTEGHAADVWAAGVRGLLLRDAPAQTLYLALSAMAQGLTVFTPDLVAELAPAGQPTPQPDAPPEVDALTPRELQVLRLLAEGLPNKTIAYQLDVSEHTVKFHVNAILGKLGAQTRTEAVIRATRLGLILL